MLQKILSVSGKPGLFRLLTQSKGTLIVESLADNKRTPIHPSDRVVALSDISMYTVGEDIPLSEVLTRLYAYQNGTAVDLKSLKDNEALRELFGKIIEEFDRERVYPSDIKKLFSWYNLLLNAGITSFVEETE